MSVTALLPAQAPLATAVLCEAFLDYPVMRFVLGSPHDYAERLHTLIGFFVAARILRQDLVLGAFDLSSDLAAVALVTLPGDRPPPEELSVRREAVWGILGAEARARYDAFGKATARFDVPAPHHHLNMIGVGRHHRGQGFARPLLSHVQRLAEADPDSAGVTLSTEMRANVTLYEHFGYRQLGYARVAAGLETWVLYLPRGAATAT
jgi:ribosomal protein S18 acetylase RimI-like enzyme